MRVDIVDVGEVEPRLAHRICIERNAPEPSGCGAGDVIGVARQAVADDLGIDLGAALLRMLIFLEHQHARALAHDEAVAVLVIRGGWRARARR